MDIPAETPATIPVVDTEPINGLLAVQVPPGVASVSEMVLPAQTVFGPTIAAGPEFTVTGLVTVQLVPPNE